MNILESLPSIDVDDSCERLRGSVQRLGIVDDSHPDSESGLPGGYSESTELLSAKSSETPRLEHERPRLGADISLT